MPGPPTYALASDTPPVGAPDNSLWWETDSGVFYIRYNDGNTTQWVIACPQPDTSVYLNKSGDTMSGPLILYPAATVSSLATNGQLAFEATSNYQLKLMFRGSDGVIRTAALTLA